MNRLRCLKQATIAIVLAASLLGATSWALAPVKAQGLTAREGQFQAPDTLENSSALASLDATSARFYETSEYMIGRVAVGLVLPESNGASDPDQDTWTTLQRQNVITEVRTALDWWAARQPAAHLSFVIDDHATIPITTSDEPIDHPQSAEGLWIGDVMTRLGYANGAYLNRVRTYVNDLRAQYHTDWAFAIFVVNSSSNPNGTFSDGYFAYAYVGGPFLVMTYDNGGYGIAHMDAVTAHEVGHIFRALDQYASANVPCQIASGYLGIENQNSQRNGCTSNVPSIMRGGIDPYTNNAIDPFAAGQIGWRDDDNDGIPDPIDTTPTLTLTTVVQSGTLWSYAGYAFDQPYPSPSRPILSINVITVDYQIDDSGWLSIPAEHDDDFDQGVGFTLTLANLPTGNHRISFQARNSAGNVSTPTMQMAILPDPVDGGLDTQLTNNSVTTTSSSSPLILGEATSFLANGSHGPGIVGVEVSVDGGNWQPAQAADGAFDSCDESFTFDSQLTPGQHSINARAMDATGKIEQHPAVLTLSISEQHALYLPLLVR